ncbi:MAG: dihydroorotase [Prevotella sp.]|nr:dihydroorotase [Prevotella sp.]
MRTLLSNATIVNEGKSFLGHLVIKDDCIETISEGTKAPCGNYDEYVDATGCFLLPGIIDTHVHFREPGLTAKADILSESRAAAWGGVTTFFDMPNTVPQTTTLEALEDKFNRAERGCFVNYSFFFGATNDNIDLISQIDPRRVPGIKVFLGASTGNMLVDRKETLIQLFRNTSLPIVAHCEDNGEINRQMEMAMKRYGDDPPVELHPVVRSAKACFDSSTLAVNLARETGARLHVAHISTRQELSLFQPYREGDKLPGITAEVAMPHLLFSKADYAQRGALVKCNPAVKDEDDREALRKALSDGRLFTVATDHAPHLRSEKVGGCRKATSGMPMVQFSLVGMLALMDEGWISMERLVQLMCHHPAMLFDIHRRGFLRTGYKADLVLVRKGASWTLKDEMVKSKCGWTPLVGEKFKWRVEHTFCNGRHILDHGRFDDTVQGEEVAFRLGI